MRARGDIRRGRLEGPNFGGHLAIGYKAQAGHNCLFVNIKMSFFLEAKG
jgi:hypothetical protein